MRKVVINVCYGMFGISNEAVQWLIENESTNLEKDGLLKNLNWNSFCDIHMRKHPSLIKVVEALGKKANGESSELFIEEIKNEHLLYRICRHDGNEYLELMGGGDWQY